jgi:1,4-alpha-glucan branching enzyme
MWAHPGKKLLFMGGEFAQRREWTHDAALEWWVTQFPLHAGVQRFVRDANRVYRDEPALHELDFDAPGFEWLVADDRETGVLAFIRRASSGAPVLAVCNFTPVPRSNYAVGVPAGGTWREILNSDAAAYGGSGIGNLGAVRAAPVPAHARYHSLSLTLPPLSTVYLKPE